MAFSKLFEPGKIGPVEVPNRIVMPPMAVGYGNGEGLLTDREIAYFEERAKGGVGLLISTAYAVSAKSPGLLNANQVNLARRENLPLMQKLVERVHAHGAKMVAQLLHTGRQAASAANNGQQPVAPSAIKEADFLEMPRAFETGEIQELVQEYIAAAQLAYEAGYDGVELHGAHGYLVYQFMAERANHRTDQYGGSFENRMRFPTEIIEGIKAIKPADRMLFMRINGQDEFDGGMTLDEGIKIAQYLESLGLDAIDLSHGTYTNSFLVAEPAPMPEGCRTEWIKKVKASLSVPLIAVNQIKRPETAEQLLQDGVVDFVGLGRPVIADPYFGKKAQQGKQKSIRNCIACGYCLDSGGLGNTVCSVNPRAGNELKYNEDTIVKNGEGKNVVVIGAGPGGMQAAIVAAQKGFDVTVFDANDQPGGSLILASKATGKDKVAWCVEGFVEEMKDYPNIRLKLDTRVNGVDDIKALDPYAVIMAAGGVPTVPSCFTVDGKTTVLAHDILSGKTPTPSGKNIAVIGSGLTGLEAADVLMQGGNKITMFEMLDELAKDANVGEKVAMLNILGRGGTQFHVLHRLDSIDGNTAVFTDLAANESKSFEFDMIVLSLGVTPANGLVAALGEGYRVEKVGDCAGGTRIFDATKGGFEAAWNL